MSDTTKENTDKDATEDQNDSRTGTEATDDDKVTTIEVSENSPTETQTGADSDEETGDKTNDTETGDSEDDTNSTGSDPSATEEDTTGSSKGLTPHGGEKADTKDTKGTKDTSEDDTETTNDKATDTTAPEMISQSTQTSVSITGTLRGPLEGVRHGTPMLCNYSDYQNQILHADFACHIEGTGTFYTFVDDDHLRLYRLESDSEDAGSWTLVDFHKHAKEANQGPLTAMIPLTKTALAILHEGKKCALFQLSPNSKMNVTYPVLEGIFRQENLINATLPTLSTSYQFSKLRGYGAEDFKIVCDDDKEILVHSIVLASRWDTIHNILVETPENKTYRVPYPLSWIEPVIAHCYGEEPKPLDLVTAVGVALVAFSFGMTELLLYALRRIRQESTGDISTNIKAWKTVFFSRTYIIFTWGRSFAAKEVIRGHLASRIQEQISTLAGSKEAQDLLKDMDKSVLICLYNDMSKNIGVEEELRRRLGRGP